MQVTETRLSLLDTGNSVKAVGSITLDKAFAIRGVRVVEDKNGRNFVSFPSREKTDGTYEEIAFPVTRELYDHIKETVLAEYDRQVEKQSQERAKEQERDPLIEKVLELEGEKPAPAPKKGRSR